MIARYNTVQEGSGTGWAYAGWTAALFPPQTAVSPVPVVDAAFTVFGQPAGGRHLNGPGVGTYMFRDCQFGGGEISFDSLGVGSVGISLTLKNCLLEGVLCSLTSHNAPATLSLWNCLLWHGHATFAAGTQGAFSVYDTLFDQTAIGQSGMIAHGYNGYVASQSRLTPTQSTDQILSASPAYQTGPLGRYYQPASALIDGGSRTAAAAGLYHYTVRADQAKETTSPVDIGFHYVAWSSYPGQRDADGDTIPDYVEDADGNGSATGDTFSYLTADTDADGLGDLQEWEMSFNVLVNSLVQDYGNEQNTQFESTSAVLDGRVMVGFVDSNQGVYALGSSSLLPTRVPRLVGLAVSRDRGATFEDLGNPVAVTSYGDAGDPVLAVDRASKAVYLVGTSPRQSAGQKGIPLWKSTNRGEAFVPVTNIREELTATDKPWLAVDDWPGTGQHDVYVTCIGTRNGTTGMWLMVSTDGNGQNWVAEPVLLDEPGAHAAMSPIITVGPDHAVSVCWFERRANVNWLKMRRVLNRGTVLGDTAVVRQLVTTDENNGNLRLKRSNYAAPDDTFKALPFPVVGLNPGGQWTGHLYVAYADLGENPGDKADVFFTQSSDAGATWSAPLRLNPEWANDQWMPVLCVKPDGTKLFVAWYDRQDDPQSSLIHVYARWGTVQADGQVVWGPAFRITTASFPPVFAGTDPYNTITGHYDPVYPPGGVNLHWHYPEWPVGDELDPALTIYPGTYASHVGEYNSACSDESSVYLTWSDSRCSAAGTVYARAQTDIRLVRLTWPQ